MFAQPPAFRAILDILHREPKARFRAATGTQTDGGLRAEFSANAEITARLQNEKTNKSIQYDWPWDCHPWRCESSDGSNMTLKIEKYSDGYCTTIRLIGRMQAEHLEELEKQVRETGPAIIFDLEEVTLVDVEIVRFLATCEARGVTLLNCSPYIRDWIGKERDL
jgi:hypothetical protein